MLPAKTKSATRFIMPAAVLLLAVSAAAILLRNRRAAVTSPIASAPAPAQPAGSASPVAAYTPPQVPLAVPASPVEAPPPHSTAPKDSTAAPPLKAEKPADSASVWVEKPSSKEPPRLLVHDHAGDLPGVLDVWTDTFKRRWKWSTGGDVVDATVPPGTYRYEIFTPGPDGEVRYGQPDITGVLRCRKYRRYEVDIGRRGPFDPPGTIHADLGDRVGE